jgi:trehalose 2-sulfotransferase
VASGDLAVIRADCSDRRLVSGWNVGGAFVNFLSGLFKEGSHAPNISRMFQGNTVFSGSEPVFDATLHILAFTNRSGSHLLAEYLTAHPGLRGFGEVLNHSVVANQSASFGIKGFPDYIAHLAKPVPIKPQAAYGVKASWDQLNMLFRWRIDKMFTDVRIVHICRHDIIGQAISYMIATQTNQWTSRQKADPDAVPRYDFNALCNHLHLFSLANDSIVITANAQSTPYHRVAYEDLVARPQDTVAGVLHFAGLDMGGYALPVPKLEKQASDLSNQFRERFLTDFRAASDQ